jgi:hypothetical protein
MELTGSGSKLSANCPPDFTTFLNYVCVKFSRKGTQNPQGEIAASETPGQSSAVQARATRLSTSLRFLCVGAPAHNKRYYCIPSLPLITPSVMRRKAILLCG